MEALILEALSDGCEHTGREIALAVGYQVGSVSSKLSKMVQSGQIQQRIESGPDGYFTHYYFIGGTGNER